MQSRHVVAKAATEQGMGGTGGSEGLSLTPDQVMSLQALVRKPRIENRLAQRARAVLLAHQGMTPPNIGRRLDMASPRVLHWCRRFLDEGIGGLADRPRSGRPRKGGQVEPERVGRHGEIKQLGIGLAAVTNQASELGNIQSRRIQAAGDASGQSTMEANEPMTGQQSSASEPDSGNTILMLSGADVARCLPMDQAVDAMRTAFSALEQGRVIQPVRSQINPVDSSGITLVMPAWIQGGGSSGHTSVKVVSVYPDNARHQVPVIHGLVLLVDAGNGKVLAGMDGGTLTALRTGAVSGLATDLLAAPAASTLAVLGAGVQARTQAAAVSAVRPLERISVYAPTATNVERMIGDLQDLLPSGISFRAATSASEALADSEIVCCATTSALPVFADSDLEPGVHINAVGVFQPDRREVPPETVSRSRVYVDDREAMHEEAGDLVIPMADGIITEDHVVGTLGELLLGRCPGRQTEAEATFFKSVGLAVQDTVAASLVFARARALGIGTAVDL